MRHLLKSDSDAPFSRPLTTGEAARITTLSLQTIIRTFDSGGLKGHKIPGSKFRQIPPDSLKKLGHDNGIDVSLPDPTLILVLSRSGTIHERIASLLKPVREKAEVLVTDCALDAGQSFHDGKPVLFLLNEEFRPSFDALKTSLPKFGEVENDDGFRMDFHPERQLGTHIEIAEEATLVKRIAHYRDRYLKMEILGRRKVTA